ncbi:NAD(P)-binding domain-containing protein [Gammaproteobacteria bacterium]|nr:NAD(P)-binding domain-containing protein [Gammaproteobacteria bacterium]
MTDVTMIGLDLMGSALARAFIGAGHSVTVWNRSADKTEPFKALGADSAGSFAQALQASPIIVVCIDSYDVTKRLLADENAGKNLSNRILIQLSSGSPKEALQLDESIKGLGGKYIDGVIRPYPEGIGACDATILFAGPERSYLNCLPFLNCLGGDLQYLGSNIKTAAVMEMASLTFDLCSYLGVMHGARICESEGISVATFASTYPDNNPANYLANIIHSDDFEDPGATFAVWDAALQGIQTQAHEAGINSEVPDFISTFFKRALSAGCGEEDVAAIVKILRSNNAAQAMHAPD